MPSIDNIEQSCIQVLVAFGSFDILTGRRTFSFLDANDGNFNGDSSVAVCANNDLSIKVE